MTRAHAEAARSTKNAAEHLILKAENKMGFGILFLGFFLVYAGSFTPLAVFTYVLGSGVILYSLKKLIFENKMFLCSAILASLLEFISIAYVILYVFGLGGSKAFIILGNVQSIFATVLAASLSIAVLIISRSVSLTKIQAKATVNIVLIAFYLICTVVLSFLKSGDAFQRLGLAALILRILYVAFSLFIIFNCSFNITHKFIS